MVEIVEVGPRDGLQNEARRFTIAQKVALVERSVAAGARRVEVASFVRADRVPQMANAEGLIAALGLVMNERGRFKMQNCFPRLGANNDEVLGGLLGMSTAEIERLRDGGAI